MAGPMKSTYSMHGLRVIENVNLTVAGTPYEVRRTWRERLLARPWRPLQRTRTIVPQVPSPTLYLMAPNTLVGHPATIRDQLRHLK